MVQTNYNGSWTWTMEQSICWAQVPEQKAAMVRAGSTRTICWSQMPEQRATMVHAGSTYKQLSGVGIVQLSVGFFFSGRNLPPSLINL